MKDAFKILVRSKRLWVAFFGMLTAAFTNLFVRYLDLPAAEATELAVMLTTVIGGVTSALLVSMGISDHGIAAGKPPGIDHKDRYHSEKDPAKKSPESESKADGE